MPIIWLFNPSCSGQLVPKAQQKKREDVGLIWESVWTLGTMVGFRNHLFGGVASADTLLECFFCHNGLQSAHAVRPVSGAVHVAGEGDNLARNGERAAKKIPTT